MSGNREPRPVPERLWREAPRFAYGRERAYWDWASAQEGFSPDGPPLKDLVAPADLLAAARLVIGSGREIEGLCHAVEAANQLGEEEALDVFVPLLERYAADPQADEASRARALYTLSFDDWSHERFESAERRYRQAAEIQERVAPGSGVLSETYTSLGLLFDTLGTLEEAEAFLEKAKALQPPESLAMAMTCYGLGNVALSRGEWSRAKSWHRRALRLRERLEPDSIPMAASYYAMGLIAKVNHRLPEAFEWFQKTLAIEERLVPGTQTLSATLHELGNFALELLRYDEAEVYYRQAASLDLPGSLGLASSYHALGNVEDERGNLVTSHGWYRKALRIRRKVAPESLDTALTYYALGGLFARRGKLDRSERWYRCALAIQERYVPDGTATAATYSSLGGLAQSRGDLASAETLYHQAEAILRRSAPQSLELASTLHERAELAASRGRYEESETLHQEALTIAEAIAPGGPEVASSLHGLGMVASRRGDHARALRYLRRSLRIDERLSPGSLEVAAAYSGLAVACLNLGRAAEGERYLEQALAIQQSIAPEGLETAASLNDLGVCHWRRREYGRADDLFRRALRIRERTAPLSLDTAETYHSLGALARVHGEWPEANRWFAKGLRIVFDHAADMDLRQGTQLFARFSTLLLDAVEAALEIGDDRHALATMERVKGFKLLQLLGTEGMSRTAEGRRVLAHYRHMEQRYEAASHAYRTAPKSRRAELRAEVQQSARERIKAGKRFLARQANLLDLDADALGRILGPNGVALQYVRLGESDDYLTLGFWDGALRKTGEVGLSTPEVDRWRVKGEALPNECPDSWDELSTDHGACLFPPEAHEALRRASRVLIAPDSDLFDLNFALLTVPGASGMLGTEAIVTHAPTFSAAVVAYGRKRTEARTGFAGGVTYGASPSGTRASSRGGMRDGHPWEPLHWTRPEAEAIASLMGTEACVDARVDREAVLAALQGADVVHLAVHGVEGDIGFDAGLILHPPERVTAEDLSATPIRAANLVFSACVSAAGRQYTGVGRVGLLHLALHQGAAAATGALWKIDDLLAHDWMTEAYRRWTAGELTWGEVLRQLLSEGNFSLRIAGAFVLYGSPDARWKPKRKTG